MSQVRNVAYLCVIYHHISLRPSIELTDALSRDMHSTRTTRCSVTGHTYRVCIQNKLSFILTTIFPRTSRLWNSLSRVQFIWLSKYNCFHYSSEWMHFSWIRYLVVVVLCMYAIIIMSIIVFKMCYLGLTRRSCSGSRFIFWWFNQVLLIKIEKIVGHKC